MRFFPILASTLALALSLVVFYGSLSYFKAQELESARARLSLHKNTLEAELRHFAHLPFILSLDPVVKEALNHGQSDALDHRLARFSQSAGVDAIYLMNSAGLTIAASNAKSAGSFKGQNYGFRPYFKNAMKGELGQFYGIGATTGIPGYFYAMAVEAPQSNNQGVVAVKVDLSVLQNNWQASGERIILSNADGVILLASDPNWRYRTLRPLSSRQRERIVESRQFGKEPLKPLDWSEDPQRHSAIIGGQHVLHLKTLDLTNNWSLHLLVAYDQAVTRAWLTLAIFCGLIMLSLIIFQVSRVRRIGAALQKSEAEEAELRRTNELLAVEIEERRAAERSLKKTQAELERAGRLAALGQLASSVTHELGQPIAAMRNQLAAAEMTSGGSALNEKMQGLVARMENVTRQLKFFSRKGRDNFEDVDLSDIIIDALELAEPSVIQVDAKVEFQRPQDEFKLFANRLRIEQVVTNVVRNALDAVEDTKIREITIRMGKTEKTVWFEVADTGHGLQEKTLDDLREPFATTRESGRGMGLGLTISAGIVSDHGGTIAATDNTPQGAIFKVELPAKHGDEIP